MFKKKTKVPKKAMPGHHRLPADERVSQAATLQITAAAPPPLGSEPDSSPDDASPSSTTLPGDLKLFLMEGGRGRKSSLGELFEVDREQVGGGGGGPGLGII